MAQSGALVAKTDLIGIPVLGFKILVVVTNLETHTQYLKLLVR